MANGNDKIKAKSEELDVILHKFSSEVGKFSNQMYSSSNEIMSIVDDMGKVWHGNGYDSFKKNMGNKIGNIESSLAKCDDLKQKLDSASKKMKLILQRLRKSE